MPNHLKAKACPSNQFCVDGSWNLLGICIDFVDGKTNDQTCQFLSLNKILRQNCKKFPWQEY